MAGSAGRYSSKPKNTNPFFDDEDADVDDDEFLRRAPNNSRFNNFSGMLTNSFSSGSNNFQPLDDNKRRDELSPEDKRQQLLMEKQRIEERTLQSTSRAKQVLYETEDVGARTAEELIRQREQLEKTNTRLDDMNNSLRSSEKHIQNIKSVFSSIKNYFSKPGAEPLKNSTESTETALPKSGSSSSNLSKTLDSLGAAARDPQPHPGLRTRGLDDGYNQKPVSSVDEQLEQDLGDMSQSLSRLKGLAQGLNVELDDQNSLIDNLQVKAEKADWRINRQNKDMERLLKK